MRFVRVNDPAGAPVLVQHLLDGGATVIALADGEYSAIPAAPFSDGTLTDLGDFTGPFQPLDADLTAIAALSTAASGRSLLTLSSQLAVAQYVGTQSINAQTGTTYTPVASDVSKLVTQSNAGAITTTLPQDSDLTWAVGDWFEMFQLGAGQITVAAGSGATLRTSGLTAKARAQYSRLFAQKIAANTWNLAGDLATS